MAPFPNEERKDIVDVLATAMAVIQRVDWGLPRESVPHSEDLKTPIVISRSGFRAAMACTCFGKRQPRLTDTLKVRSEDVTPEEVRPFLYHLVSVIYPINVWSREGWQEPEARQTLFACLRLLMRNLVDLAGAEQMLLATMATDGGARAREFFNGPPFPLGTPEAARAIGDWLLASGWLWAPCAEQLRLATEERLPFAWVALQRLVLSSQAMETVPDTFRRASTIIARLYA